jgi:hypothetical protein
MKKIKCKNNCGNKPVRIDKYDAYACRSCNIWLERKCDDCENKLCPNCNCIFCCNRPDTPENVDWDDPNNTQQK